MTDFTLRTAKAVRGAYEEILEAECVVTATDFKALAAALRAVADCVVPQKPEPTENSVGPTVDYGYAWALVSQSNDIRQELIAIADELENNDH